MSGYEIGEVFNGTYRLERLIGQGAMGTVYEVSHLRLPRRFAMKVLDLGTNRREEVIARFRREAEIASTLKHPNVLDVIDFNEIPDGAFYIVMELLEGEDLRARLKEGSQCELPVVSSVLRQVASALEHVHSQGVVHRDLKPDNIFLCPSTDGEDFVKVVDFGISKVVGETKVRLTGSTTVLGTPMYMSPEQASGSAAAADPTTDVYSMGVILYEMLTGRTPFRAPSVPALMLKIVSEAAPPVLSRRPDIPVALDDVVRKSLEKEAADRYQSMKDLWIAYANAVGIEATPLRTGLARGISATDLAATRTDNLLGATRISSDEPESRSSLMTSGGHGTYAETGPVRADSKISPMLLGVLGVAVLLAALFTLGGGDSDQGPIVMPQPEVNAPSFVIKHAPPKEAEPVEAPPRPSTRRVRRMSSPPKAPSKQAEKTPRKSSKIRDGLMDF